MSVEGSVVSAAFNISYDQFVGPALTLLPRQPALVVEDGVLVVAQKVSLVPGAGGRVSKVRTALDMRLFLDNLSAF